MFLGTAVSPWAVIYSFLGPTKRVETWLYLYEDHSSDAFRRLSDPLLCVYLLYWVHEKNVKEKELNVDLLSLTLVLWMILLELLICRERYQSSLRSTPIPNHSPASFCFLLQAVSFWTWANYISESRRERRFGQERTTCWQVLLGSFNLYPQGICFLLIGLLAHSDLADRKHNREAF